MDHPDAVQICECLEESASDRKTLDKLERLLRHMLLQSAFGKLQHKIEQRRLVYGDSPGMVAGQEAWMA